MRLTVFGATGGTGTQLVQQALAAGHEVSAVVRDPARLAIPTHPRLRVVTADIMDPASIRPAVTGADVVLTAAGPRNTGPTTVITDSVRSISAAMQAAGVRRLVALSGSIVADNGDGLFLRYLLKPLARRTFLRNVCADMRQAEASLADSGLDWTIVRPPALTDGPATGHYRTAVDRNLPRGFRVSRADLAAYMLSLVGETAAVRRHVAIAY
ncbi:MAG: SDR family oxidoreductase [Actinobacteria bacterium]|nr:SDR family oxidoreductase [Actinomycetota bacterium]